MWINKAFWLSEIISVIRDFGITRSKKSERKNMLKNKIKNVNCGNHNSLKFYIKKAQK